MKKSSQSFLFDLLATPSPTGFEAPGQRKWLKHIAQFADSTESDTYGTAWATINGSAKDAPTVMLESHADEIGYIVKYITDDGFLHIDLVGGSDAATGRGRRIDIFGDKGTVRGVIGNTAIHLRKDLGNEKAPKIHELYVDVGATSKKEVEELGIRVGVPAVYIDGPEMLGKNLVMGRALDNRVGGFIIAEVMRKLAEGKKKPKANIVAVNAVQEEIGGYGAKMATHRISPDVAVVLDVTHATDTPGIPKEIHGSVTLGGGPSISHGTCNHPEVVKRLMQVAEESQVTLQHESSSRYSGTDTDQIYHIKNGIPSGLISLPLRYMHSVVETAHIKDIEKTIELLYQFVLSVEPKDEFKVRLLD
ncbi:M42 family metallopeptidase [Sulfuriroseicoccus oceanibius]|uniref:M42 family metallopeptidase n=1 Tax=Sulfuriroseicoccus oceanibius TaxID=2707525 RepID=A0A6B3L3I6_9BACT|nr:M42 family metallopeptidase [Sulfuriroseicoccus oceanibius]QQL46010.1 M42 family metallopeptidase [Sulfuriroseicoccus oceanibius]